MTPADLPALNVRWQRKRQQRQIASAAVLPDAMAANLSSGQPVSSAVRLPVTHNVTVTPITLPVTRPITLPFTANITHVTESNRQVTGGRPISSHAVTAAALALAVVGITMNGCFARTLGETDLSGWLFLAIGVAADLVALAVPPTAVQLWQARRRATAITAWLVWATSFAFAVSSGIGFASVNIADVTLTRASRVTPAVTIAQVRYVTP